MSPMQQALPAAGRLSTLLSVAVVMVVLPYLDYEGEAFTAGALVQRAPAEVLAGAPDHLQWAAAPRLSPGGPKARASRNAVTVGQLSARVSGSRDGPAAPARPLVPAALAALVGLVLGARRARFFNGGKKGGVIRSAAAVVKVEVDESALQSAATTFCNLFALWLAITAVAAVNYPPSFTWVKSSYFTGLLGLLMFSVGITTTIDDFKACFSRPGAVAINFISCYGIMPLLAYAIAQSIGASGPILAGMVLVGAINGGQASNLCTLIAGGDVALSVLMTTSTTLGCILMTPSICKLVLGAVVPVDAVGIIISTIQVVLAPIFLGVGANTLAPGACKAVAPFTPVIGVIATVLLVGASVANCAKPILSAGLPLQGACLALHLIGGVLGFFATKAGGYDERTCRTVAIETSMKSSAFAFLLATLHFGSFNVRVPAAVSVVWMAIVGSVLAVYWKGKPTTA